PRQPKQGSIRCGTIGLGCRVRGLFNVEVDPAEAELAGESQGEGARLRPSALPLPSGHGLPPLPGKAASQGLYELLAPPPLRRFSDDNDEGRVLRVVHVLVGTEALDPSIGVRVRLAPLRPE